MRRRGVALGAAFLAMAALPGQSCGPFFPEAIFVLRQPESRVALMSGKPGIVWPDFNDADMALAYRALQGPSFTPAEIDGERPPQAPADAVVQASGEVPTSALAQWVETRKAFTGQEGGPIPTDASVPGQQWQSFGNCLADAFATAAKTLESRERDHALAKPAVAEWVRGQDAVFSNCADAGELPAEPEASSPEWLRRDRAYQLAAAHFYRMEWQPAQAEFAAIAADPQSSWRELGSYMVARTLIRQAMLAKPDSVDQDLLRQAETQLQASARGTGRYAGAALAMLNFVQLRIAPATAAARLGDSIAKPGSHLHQDLIDLRYALGSPALRDDLAVARRSDLVDWVLTTKSNLGREDAAAHALARWRATRSAAWLASAMTLAQKPPADKAADLPTDLMAAAAALPMNSPAWATVAYHRLRLAQARPGFEAEVAALLPKVDGISTRNAFQELAQAGAPSLDAFVQTAAMEPAAYDDGEGDLTSAASFVPTPTGQTTPTMAGLPVDLPGAKRFNPDSAVVLNERLPLDTLAAIVQRRAFPRQLQFELAMAVWTRAVLLGRPDVARALTAAMVEGEPGWKPWLLAYDNATTAADRRAAALLALMRFPSVRPYVNAGPIRAMGFAGYDSYRDNWWCAGMGHDPSQRNGYSGAYNFQGGSQPVAGPVPAPPPAPPFVTAQMAARAASESAALAKIGDAPRYFGEQALAWAKAHPGDPRSAELLGFAYRAMRNGCNLEESAALKREVFDLLHARYAQSEWARRYKTLGGDGN